MQRSLLKFENAIKSEETKKLYNYYLKKFLEWCKIPSHDGLLQLKDSFLQEILEDYLFYQKNRISPNSIPPIFASLELFFTMNDKVLNFKKLRKMFPQKIKISGKDIWQTKDIQFMLKNIKVKRTRAMIHFLASTGCRIGVLQDLKIKHLQDYDLLCKKIVFYEGTNSEYVCFLTPEASRELEEYFDERRKSNEYFTPETPVFRSRFFVGSSKAKPLAIHSIKTNLYRVIHRLSTRKKVGERYNIQAEHGFRKRFATILKSNDESNVSLVEGLLGHKGVVKLDSSYFNPSVEKLFFEFKKHIINLTISDSERLELQNKTQDETIKKMESEKDLMIKDYGERLSNTEKIIRKLEERLDSKTDLS